MTCLLLTLLTVLLAIAATLPIANAPSNYEPLP